MGLFQHKKQAQPLISDDGTPITEAHFMDETFREELRNHGRWYFEKVINENAVLFKQDLDATVADIRGQLQTHIGQKLDSTLAELGAELKQHIITEIDGQLAGYTAALKDAQDTALKSLQQNTDTIQAQHQALSKTFAETIASQDILLKGASEKNIAQMEAMQHAQSVALESLNRSAVAIEEQQKHLGETLEKTIADQKAMLIAVFENNLAQIIEHYVLESVGDAYDLKAQVPAIIQQMEANKQAIIDDMKL